MEKKMMYIIFAVGLVLLFMIEPFAIGMMQNAGKATSAIEKKENITAVGSITGNAVANVTIAKYKPYVIVVEDTPEAETVKDRLIGEGIATYAVKQGKGLVVSLKDGKSVPYAAEEFSKVNASVLASMTITTQDKFIVSDGKNSMEVEGTTFDLQAEPVYEEGSTQEARFLVQVQDGTITGAGNFNFVPAVISGVAAQAQLLPVSQQNSVIEVIWKDRVAAKKIAQEENATFKERSFIVYSGNASADAVSAAGTKTYVTGVQGNVVSVKNDFVDKEMAMADLALLGSIGFPPSLVSFANESEGKLDALIGKLAAAGVNATLVKSEKMGITLPESVEKEGKKYALFEREFEIDAAGIPENASVVNATFDLQMVSAGKYSVVSGSLKIG